MQYMHSLIHSFVTEMCSNRWRPVVMKFLRVSSHVLAAVTHMPWVTHTHGRGSKMNSYSEAPQLTKGCCNTDKGVDSHVEIVAD